MEVKVDIPESFIWVINYMKEWKREQKQGEIRLKYKDGGICAIEINETIRPGECNENKKNISKLIRDKHTPLEISN